MSRHQRTVVLSGIPAGTSGTGRLVGHLREQLRKSGRSTYLIAKPERPPVWLLIHLWRQRKIRSVVSLYVRYVVGLFAFLVGLGCVRLWKNTVLILLHPQNLGFKRALQILERRKEPTLLYLLDSSFFCVASYNYVRGERTPCIRCIGGAFGQREMHGCSPFPQADGAASLYVERLQELVAKGIVRLVAQNAHQADLARQHFHLPVTPPVIGLWTNDWDDVFSDASNTIERERSSAPPWDVVFHGHCLEPKGALWLIETASHCEKMNFLFPFAQPSWLQAPANCHFKTMSWEAGLQEVVAGAWCTAVPSLWSAPIEGALIKSLVVAPRVAVVANNTSFSDEIPDGLLLRLPSDPAKAAIALMMAKESRWAPDAVKKREWLRSFKLRGDTFAARLFDTAVKGEI